MTKYSIEDLILFIYGETTVAQTQDISIEIQSDWILREKYQALKESMKGLNSVVRSPRQQTINAILEYAKSTTEVAP